MNMTAVKSTYKLGVIALLVSAVLTSISQVFYANQVQGVSPFLFTGISFLLTALYFQIFTIKQKVKPNWAKAKWPLVKLNIASAATFMSFYFALKYIEPAIVSSLEMGVAPLFIILLMVVQRQAISTSKWIISFGTLGACLLLIYAVFNGSSALAEQVSTMTFVAIAASVICGIGAVYCSQFSRELNAIGWTSSMILSKRYIVIIVISFILTYDEMGGYLMDNIVWIVAVTILGVLVPNYLLQKGIQFTNTFLVMMSLSFIPVITFVSQLLDERLQFSYITLFGVLILFCCGIWSLIEEKEKA